MKQFLKQKREVNYLYFSFFLIFLSTLSLFHYKEQSPTFVPIFFLSYAIGQAFFEVCLFALLTYLLKRWLPRWLFLSFIGISFLLLPLHFTNFIMARLMDASLGYIIQFFCGSGIEHWITGFQALNMNMTMIGIIGGTIVAIPIAGLGFYWLTHRISRAKPLYLSFNQILLTIGIAGTSLLILDIGAHPFLNRGIYTKYQKTLPLGTTFLPPTQTCIFLSSPFAPLRKEGEVPPPPPIQHLSNIYFFVIETFRNDFLYAAPHLTQFGHEHIEFKSSFANANCTHLSWFSLFHADIPFHWASVRDTWKKGSIPLQLLKQMGYQIHVYSSADLRYFGMDKIIFGNSLELATTIEDYSSDRRLEPYDRDALSMNAVKRDLAKEGHVYLIFLDSTHSEYSFPKNFPLQYEPISKEIDYLSMGPKSPELELMKNRYRNAIAYVDHLMGDFFDTLKKENLFDDAIIAITGDHGEEFFEEGALFHGTHLNHYQTNVPILMKFPNPKVVITEEAMHIDIFPSILHHLMGENSISWDGKSIFGITRHPFRIAVLQNGPDKPIEFSIEKTDLKLRAHFVNPSKLEIVELQGSLEPGIFSPLLKNRKID